LIVVTNESVFTWDEINNALFYKLGWSPRQIVVVLAALPRGKSFRWAVINGALVECGYSAKQILRVLEVLK
jgi:hypothetical protein